MNEPSAIANTIRANLVKRLECDARVKSWFRVMKASLGIVQSCDGGHQGEAKAVSRS